MPLCYYSSPFQALPPLVILLSSFGPLCALSLGLVSFCTWTKSNITYWKLKWRWNVSVSYFHTLKILLLSLHLSQNSLSIHVPSLTPIAIPSSAQLSTETRVLFHTVLQHRNQFLPKGCYLSGYDRTASKNHIHSPTPICFLHSQMCT